MTVSVGKGISATNFTGNVERFSRKIHFSPPKTEKVSLRKVGGYISEPSKTAGKEGTEPMEKSQELIGILQAISIVAKSLAAKLMQIEKEVEAYEAAKAAHDRKTKKGWRR